jgi:hypothetical protein
VISRRICPGREPLRRPAPRRISPHIPSDFTGYDVATLHIGDGRPPHVSAASCRRWTPDPRTSDLGFGAPRDFGIPKRFNAWAFAPSRTNPGRPSFCAILIWPGTPATTKPISPSPVVDFMVTSDWGPLGVVGGFNRHLGWSTTNSNTGSHGNLCRADGCRATDHYRLDGASLPLTKTTRTVEYSRDRRCYRDT